MGKLVRFLRLDGNPLRLESGKKAVGVFPICGQQVYERGIPLDYTVRTTNASDFTEVVFVIRGTSPYTLQLEGISEEEARILSRRSELEWLSYFARHAPDLADHVTLRPDEHLDPVDSVPTATRLTKPYRVLLWEEVLVHPTFFKGKEALDKKYAEQRSLATSARPANPTLRKAFNKRISFYTIVTATAQAYFNAYLSHHVRDFSVAQIQQADTGGIDLCVAHQLEERSADLVLAECGTHLVYNFYYGADDVRKLPKLIEQTLAEFGKTMTLVTTDFVGFPEVPSRRSKSTKFTSKDRATLRLRAPERETLAPPDGGDTSPRAESAPEPLEGTASRADVSSAAYPEERIQEFLRHTVSFIDGLDTPHCVELASDLLSVVSQRLTRTGSGHTRAPKATFAFAQETPPASAADSTADPAPTVVVAPPTEPPAADPQP